MLRSLIILSAFILVLSCGESSPSPQEGPEPDTTSSLELVPVLQIGLEMGDSNYVFGDIIDACILQGGTILVLDSYDNTISAYDPGGNFTGRTGGSGEGPGEYLGPFAMVTLEDGRILVSDAQNTRATILDPDLNVSEIISGFVPWPPTRVSAASGSSYVGARRVFERESSLYGHMVALWSSSPEPDVEYYRELGDFNMERLRESTEANQVVFTSDYAGRVYIAPYSTDEYRIDVLDSTGVLIYSIAESREPLDRPDEEIQREMEEMRQQLEREGAPEMAWNPVQQYYLIPLRGMGVDSEGRLWVQDGRYGIPHLSVYLDGEFQFEAIASHPDLPSEGLSVKVTPYGILAWEEDPASFPRLYLLELRNTGS